MGVKKDKQILLVYLKFYILWYVYSYIQWDCGILKLPGNSQFNKLALLKLETRSTSACKPIHWMLYRNYYSYLTHYFIPILKRCPSHIFFQAMNISIFEMQTDYLWMNWHYNMNTIPNCLCKFFIDMNRTSTHILYLS